MIARLLLIVAVVASHYAGHPLAEALRDLQTRGLRLIYSDDVVLPSMIVRQEPRSTTPRAILDELLAEHRLHATDGPRGSLLIVRDERPAETEKKQTPPRMPVALAEIVVTPSRFELLSSQPEQRQFLGREEVRAIPHLSDDLFRAIGRIPGTTAHDTTARFNIRGGADDEVLAIIDGAEVYDPYHLRDLFRAFSTIDAEAIGSVDVLTGGFPAEYGGRMSGVIDISTLTADGRHSEVGISLLNTRAMSSGAFDAGRGQWLVTFRRGYLREMLKLIDVNNQLDPHYYDLLGKVQWTLGDAAVASLHALASRDLIKTVDAFDANARAKYDDTYLWLNLRGSPREHWFAQSVLSYGAFGRSRRGDFVGDDQGELGALDDHRGADFVALKNDASFHATERNLLKGGITLRRLHAHYDYTSSATILYAPFRLGRPPSRTDRSAHVRVSSTEVAAYAADRFRLGDNVVAELGARAESETHTPDGAHFSPRVNVSWFAGERTVVRAAWGRFYQPEAIYELPVEDGVTRFEGAERSEHRVLGIEQRFGGGWSARAELYDKSFSNLRPRFENLFNRLVIFPELHADRVRIAPERASAHGAEILLRRDNGGPVSGWISYAHATVEDRLGGADVPRSWDQRDSVTFSVNYRRERWNFNVAGTWHSGWPTTPVVARVENGRIVSDLGPLNSTRLPTYRRVDFRASRHAGSLGVFLELFNVLNFTNAHRVSSFTFDVQPDGTVRTTAASEAIFGVVPSFGVTWRF